MIPKESLAVYTAINVDSESDGRAHKSVLSDFQRMKLMLVHRQAELV